MATSSEAKRARLAQLLRDKARKPRTAPASFTQERFWFLERLSPGSAAANMAVAVRLTGRLDEGALQRALQEVVGRHETLRTTFDVESARPIQVIAPFLAIRAPVVDLTASPEAEREAEARAILDRESRMPFDLSTGPLFRPLLVRLGERERVLSVTVHHIVSDGWSMGVLVRELGALYQASVEGRAAALPPLPLQYADYATWQRASLHGEALDAQLAYWRARLDPDAILSLPTDRPRPVSPSPCGARHVVFLHQDLAQSLRALARREGTTLFVVLMAVLQTLLSRYSGQTDLTVGSPIAGRNRTELEGLVGPLINTLALRVDLSGDPTFRELCRRTHEVALGAYAHQDLPFERLVSELGTGRRASHTPIFQVMLILQTDPMHTVALPGLVLDAQPVDTRTTKVDLLFSAVELPRDLRLTVEYSTDLFDAGTVERMIGHYRTLLSSVVADPASRLSDVSLLSAEERRTLLARCNDSAAGASTEGCVHELFEAQVERAPDAIAAVFGSEALTYRELDRRADLLAHRLRALGVGPDVRVALCVERSFEMMVGLFGILEAGGAYVPLDPEYPKDRLAFMLGDSGAGVLLTLERIRHLLPPGRARVLCLDADQESTDPGPESAPPDVSPANLAYVIYTSGSTGRPKGAMNTHRGIVNRLLWMQEAYTLTATDRVLQKTPVSFDVSVWELFWPLATGATLVLAAPGGHRDAKYLVDLIAEEGITTTHFVPSMLSSFLERPDVERCTSARCPSTLVCLSAGVEGRSPLFLVHGAGGGVLAYAELCRALDPSRPVYGVDATDPEGGGAPPSLEAMAHAYLAEIRAVQPRGPYLLGGWSSGGVVAFEMAQQLVVAGETVAMLALLDSHAPIGETGPAPDPLATLAAFGVSLGLPWRDLPLDLEHLRRLDVPYRLAHVLDVLGRSPLGALDLDPAEAQRRFRLFDAHVEAVGRYAPRRYTGLAVLLRVAIQRGSATPPADLGWATWIEGIATAEIPGDHRSMLRPPHVALLAAQLERHLGLACRG